MHTIRLERILWKVLAFAFIALGAALLVVR
jgi:hypothetical protein